MEIPRNEVLPKIWVTIMGPVDLGGQYQLITGQVELLTDRDGNESTILLSETTMEYRDIWGNGHVRKYADQLTILVNSQSNWRFFVQ